MDDSGQHQIEQIALSKTEQVDLIDRMAGDRVQALKLLGLPEERRWYRGVRDGQSSLCASNPHHADSIAIMPELAAACLGACQAGLLRSWAPQSL